MLQEPGDQHPGRRHDDGHQPRGLEQHQGDIQHAIGPGIRQHGDQQHHRHHRQVLKDQDADRGAAVHRLALTSLRQRLQDNRRATQRGEAPPEERLSHRDAGQGTAGHDQRDDTDHLDGAADQEKFPSGHGMGQRKLHANREEQEHHADLGQDFDLPRVGDQIEARRADE